MTTLGLEGIVDCVSPGRIANAYSGLERQMLSGGFGPQMGMMDPKPMWNTTDFGARPMNEYERMDPLDRYENPYFSPQADRAIQQAYSPGGILSDNPGILERTDYAKPCSDWGTGTIENISVDFGREERIKTYTDVVNNNIKIGYERFEDDHRDKYSINIGQAYPQRSWR